MPHELNERSRRLVDSLVDSAPQLGVRAGRSPGGGMLVDCGVEAPGGLEAGRLLARICMADLACVEFVPGELQGSPLPMVQVITDHPVAACLASQYAGWAIRSEGFFAMGSGPMRSAHGAEELFETIGHRENATSAVGVLESRALPSPEVFEHIGEGTGVPVDSVRLLVAPTASPAGGVQVVARSIETALHKLHHLGFDLTRIQSGWGVAPLPPVARDDLGALGRTNDCVLYGARVILWVRGDDESLRDIGPRVPSSASGEHGSPFLRIFERHDRDFYRIDPLLFSPAQVSFQNVQTGRTFTFGRVEPEILARSLSG